VANLVFVSVEGAESAAMRCHRTYIWTQMKGAHWDLKLVKVAAQNSDINSNKQIEHKAATCTERVKGDHPLPRPSSLDSTYVLDAGGKGYCTALKYPSSIKPALPNQSTPSRMAIYSSTRFRRFNLIFTICTT
jgi:hypothetical protein